MISTINAVIGDQVLDTGFHVTTPDAPDVQRYLAQMVDDGAYPCGAGGHLPWTSPIPGGCL